MHDYLQQYIPIVVVAVISTLISLLVGRRGDKVELTKLSDSVRNLSNEMDILKFSVEKEIQELRRETALENKEIRITIGSLNTTVAVLNERLSANKRTD